MIALPEPSPATQCWIRFKMPLITLRAVSYALPDGKALFQNLDITFGAGRTGLIGRNGVGKSSLLRLAEGTLHPDAGTVLREGTMRMLRQETSVRGDVTVADAFGVSDDLARLRRA